MAACRPSTATAVSESGSARLLDLPVPGADIDRWHGELDRLHARNQLRFRRSEPRRRVPQYLCGLVPGLAVKTNGP